MEFNPTVLVGSTLVEVRFDEKGKKHYHDADGKEVWRGNRRISAYTPPPPALVEPEVYEPFVNLHAAAATCVLMAATLPEWQCAYGFAQSARGDSAEVMNERGPNGEKVVRLCEVSPGRISTFYKVLVPEFISFEKCP